MDPHQAQQRGGWLGHLARAGAAVAMAGALTAGGFAVVAAASTGHGSSLGLRPHDGGGSGGDGITGMVTGIDPTGGTVTVQPSSGAALTITTTSSTTYSEACAAATPNALAVGQQVVVQLTAPYGSSDTSSGTGAGSSDVCDEVLHQSSDSGSSGSGSSGSGSSGSARAHAQAPRDSSPCDVSGVSTVSGSSSDCTPAGTPTASAIDIVLPYIAGQVQAGSTTAQFVVQDSQGFWRTIITSSSTTYSSGGAAVTSAAIVPGSDVVAFGTVDANHTALDATTVYVLGPTTEGTVQVIRGDHLVLRAKSGARLSVVAGPHTLVRVHGKRASLHAIKHGARVTVLGRRVHGVFRATEIRA